MNKMNNEEAELLAKRIERFYRDCKVIDSCRYSNEYEVVEWTEFDQRLCHSISPKSVKRLSDGEIFSIDAEKMDFGNVMDGKCIVEELGVSKIRSFYVSHKNEILARPYTNNIYGNAISSWNKVKKKPVLVTLDGKDIYEGDDVWTVMKDGGFGGKVDWNNDHPIDGVFYFSTQIKAISYIKLNTKVFSLKDIHEAFYLHRNQTLEGAYDILKKQVDLYYE